MTPATSVPSGPGRPPFTVEGRRVLVVGAARSGLAAAELLVTRGASVTLDRSRGDDPRRGAAARARRRARPGRHHARLFLRADLIVTSPGVPPELAELQDARAAGVPVIGELELAWRWLKGRVIAITGTKGKSTTTTLVGRMLEASGKRVLVGGNIGVPLSAHVDRSTPDTLHVVEASSFQLEATDTFHPWIAALLNLSADHLDRHPDLAAYARAKARVFAQSGSRRLGRGRRRPSRDADARRVGTRPRWSATRLDAPLDDGVSIRGRRRVAPHLRRRRGAGAAGRHRAATGGTCAPTSSPPARSATSLARRPTAWPRRCAAFTGLEHVMEPVGEVRGVRFVNDSKATNVDAAGRSIESFDGVVAIVGGKVQGRPVRGSGRSARRARAGRGGHRRGPANGARGAGRHRAGGGGRRRWPTRSQRAYALAAARRRRAAGAGVLQLRHVHRLRRSRAGVQGRGEATRGSGLGSRGWQTMTPGWLRARAMEELQR